MNYWFRNAVFYNVDVTTFRDLDGDGWGDLAGLRHRLDYLRGLGIDAMWLQPFFGSPWRDNGYDVSDSLGVQPRFGEHWPGVLVRKSEGRRSVMPTEPHTPPMSPSNEATSEQLRLAREEGDAYGKALQAMAEEDGAAVTRAGDYIVAFVEEEAEGMWAPGTAPGELVWHEADPQANCHLEVAVADGGDGRFVPELTVTVTLSDRAGKAVVSQQLPFLWHPFLYHYGTNAAVPDEGPFTVTVRIDPPTFMRHDPINGKRFADPVEVTFPDQRFSLGRKLSPDAEPLGEPAPTAGRS